LPQITGNKNYKHRLEKAIVNKVRSNITHAQKKEMLVPKEID